jgi:hypothetical protein
MARKVKRAKKAEWLPLPEQNWQQWFAQYVTAGLVLEYYNQYKKMPKMIKPGSVDINDLESGDGLLSAELK